MPIDQGDYSENEAWVLFQLNTAPVRTEADGDFNAVAIMEIVSGTIFGMELVPVAESEMSEFQSRKLLRAAESQANSRPRLLFIPSEREATHLSAAASKMGIVVERRPASEFASLTKEAIESFAAHVSGERHQ